MCGFSYALRDRTAITLFSNYQHSLTELIWRS